MVGSAEAREAERVGYPTGLTSGQDPPTVLVIDDVEVNRTLLRELLGGAGIHVEEAGDGATGVAAFERIRPDLVMMDVRMPNMDGLEATRLIRSSEAGRATPILVLTASGSDADMQSVMDSGADGFLGKPFREGQIWSALERHLGVEFEWSTEESFETGRGDTDGPTPAEVASLDTDFRQQLRDAVERGDLSAARSLISRGEGLEPSLAHGLLRLLDNYDYEALFLLL